MTIKLAPPYSLWDVPSIGAEAGLKYLTMLDFDQKAFPGYHHVTTQADAKALRVGSKKDANRCKVRSVTRTSEKMGGAAIFMNICMPNNPPFSPNPIQTLVFVLPAVDSEAADTRGAPIIDTQRARGAAFAAKEAAEHEERMMRKAVKKAQKIERDQQAAQNSEESDDHDTAGFDNPRYKHVTDLPPGGVERDEDSFDEEMEGFEHLNPTKKAKRAHFDAESASTTSSDSDDDSIEANGRGTAKGTFASAHGRAREGSRAPLRKAPKSKGQKPLSVPQGRPVSVPKGSVSLLSLAKRAK